MTLAFPPSYRDPAYDALAAAAEQRYNLPRGILDAIRLRGERSNANKISPAGARTPYQFIPSTRQGMIRNYGTDPWTDAPSATNAAAQLLVENHDRAGGSWNKAIAMYNGGNHPGRDARRYQARVGDFDNIDTSKSYYTGAGNMPDNLPPVDQGYYPLAPERPSMPVPLPGPGPSVNASAASPLASHKRGGILGALESVFMPDPGSRWAGALRDGLFNAKESQQTYQVGRAKQLTDSALANAKLKQMMTKGEYQIVGNNVLHIPADGGPAELITPPTTPSEHERLIDRWRSLDASDPVKELIHQMLLGGNSEEVLRSKENQARIRAGATTGAAHIRANAATHTLPPIPLGFAVVK